MWMGNLLNGREGYFFDDSHYRLSMHYGMCNGFWKPFQTPTHPTPPPLWGAVLPIVTYTGATGVGAQPERGELFSGVGYTKDDKGVIIAQVEAHDSVVIFVN